MNCPHCNQVQPENATECNRCGVIFAKWRERQARIQASLQPASGAIPSAGPSESGTGSSATRPVVPIWARTARNVFIGIGIIWAGFCAYYFHRLSGAYAKKAQDQIASQQQLIRQAQLLRQVSQTAQVNPEALTQALQQAHRMDQQQFQAASQIAQQAQIQQLLQQASQVQAQTALPAPPDD